QYLARRAELAAGATSGRTQRAEAPKTDGAARQAARKELNRLERTVDKLTEREVALHAALAEAATEPDKLVSLGAELKEVQAQKESAEERWLELADQI